MGKNGFVLILLVFLLLVGAINRSLTNDQLQFLLYPIQILVGHFENSQFQYFSEFGYVQTNGLITINASCSGFLFFTVLTAVGVFLIWKISSAFNWFRTIPQFLIVLVLAYVTTIVVNASRILLSIDMLHMAHGFTWFPNKFAHEAFGIFSFLIFSTLYYVSVKQILTRWTN